MNKKQLIALGIDPSIAEEATECMRIAGQAGRFKGHAPRKISDEI